MEQIIKALRANIENENNVLVDTNFKERNKDDSIKSFFFPPKVVRMLNDTTATLQAEVLKYVTT